MILKTNIARILYPVGAIRKVLRGPIHGTRFHVIPGMGATYALGQDHWGFYFFQSKIRPGMAIYDIGANCGQMALYFSKMVGQEGKVVSFEPVSTNADTLRKNLTLNKIANVHLIEAAVSSDSETKVFYFDQDHHTMGTLQTAMVTQGTWSTTFEVPCVRLDDLLCEGTIPPPDWMKIDVEGAGLSVIEGALTLIREHLPSIYFEVHAADSKAHELHALHRLKNEFGYDIKYLNGTPLGRECPVWGEAVWCAPRLA